MKIQNTSTSILVQHVAKNTFHSIITWEWTKRLLYWVIISAGTMSECVFLVASLWMSVNSSVHPLVLLFMNEGMTRHISEFATAAYVALPECILGLAFVTVISHLRVWLYCKSLGAAIWTILYGLPTLVFLVLSLITLANSVASTSFIMPEPLIIIRALAGYMFAFTSLLHTQLGTPQERDRLEAKDTIITEKQEEYTATLADLTASKDAMLAQLRTESDEKIKQLRLQVEMLTAEIENQKHLLAESKNVQSELQKAANKSDEIALQAYSEECLQWLKSGLKTVTSEDITRYTGHSKRKIESAITKGYLQTSPRNKDLILVSSLVPWLKSVQSSSGKTGEMPALHIVNG